MREDQTQLFKMEYGTRCDIFGCGESGAYFVGRPDGPLNTCMVLCESCTATLRESVKVEDEPISQGIEIASDAAERISDAKAHTTLDELVEEFKFTGVPTRETAKLIERKAFILAAHNASLGE
jgi:hypothetical protein